MTIALLTNIVSPHQLPLARELVKQVGAENYRYVYTEPFHAERAKMGWDDETPGWCLPVEDSRQFLEEADLVYCEERDLALFRKRTDEQKKTIYVSERWFKPILLPFGLSVSGILKLLSPWFLKMARGVVKLLEQGNLMYLPQGIWAARDMARLCGLMHGDLRCLFRAPKVEFEREPGGRIWVSGGVDECGSGGVRCCLGKMRMWGYFVEECKIENVKCKIANLKVLWVGRLLGWKRVDTIIRAVGELAVGFSGSGAFTRSTRSTRLNISLDIYGIGPEEARLKRLASKYGDVIKFHPPVPICEVRRLMHEHDVYVLASNAYEGWGAVVSEALEEGMKVIGTYEAGSSATILPQSCLFHAGDWRRLAELLQRDLPNVGIGDWTAKQAAKAILQLAV